MTPQHEAKTKNSLRKPQTVILIRDRIYAYLRGCERGDSGLLKNVPNATISDLTRFFNKRESVKRREVNKLVAAGGAGVLGDKVYPLRGYKMRTVSVNPPRQTYAPGRKLATRKLAGHEITLAEGVRYVATRPMAPPPNKLVTISIRELPGRIGDLAVLELTAPSREDADKLLRRFNGRNSLDGRVW